MTINLTIPKKQPELKPRIVVFGVGGAGGNAVNNMIRSDLQGVDFVVGNTDAQALEMSQAERKIQLGVTITEGLGAGSRPDIGRAAAEEGIDDILDAMGGTHMTFITAGMGGGTGSGAAPVIARAARERGILTVGVVTKPFHFEGQHRMKIAEEAIEELQQYVDTLIIIPNQNLFRVANEKTTFADAFKMADDVLYSGVRGVTDLMVMPGLINLDFADIRTVMSEMGKAMMGTGEAEGEQRAVAAAEAAISNPLLDEISMKGARGVLINITGGPDLTLFEVDEAANRIRDEVDPHANIIFGSTFDESMDGVMRVSVVATGIDANVMVKPRPTTISLVSDNAHARPAAAPKPAEAPAPASFTRRTEAVAVARAEPEPEPFEDPVADEVAIAEMTAIDDPFDMPAMTAPVEEDEEEATLPVVEPEDELPAAAIAEPEFEEDTRAADAFIAPPAMQRVNRPAPEERPDPYAQADYVNAARPAPEPRKAEGSRAGGLFRRVTRAARDLAEGHQEERPAQARREPQVAPARREPAAPPAARREADVRPIQPRLGGLDPSERPTTSKADEDLLEIPAFLRRQAN